MDKRRTAAAGLDARPGADVSRTEAASVPREIDARELFAGANALLIRHGDERYTLRRTSKGKLILTK
jgi:hemin uptake protein HemP